MAINPNYKKPKTGAGELKHLVSFFEYKPKNGFETGDEEYKLLFRTMCEYYNPSLKDMEVLGTQNTKRGLTILIRDPLQDYQPTNKHRVELQDYHFVNGDKFIRWNVVNVSTQDGFIKIILGDSQ